MAGYGRALGLLFQIADDLADGDAAFTDRPRLAARAEECRRDTESFLSELPRNDASVTLADLPGHILLSPAPRR